MKKRLFLVVALLVAMAPGAWAQVATGNIYGTVTDESGAVLPGATVTVSGPTMGARSTTSSSGGDFRFLTLSPDKYKLVVVLTGFTTIHREVIVETGANVNLTFGLKVATVEESVTVTAETPIVDTKKLGTSTNFSGDELTKIPSARDPWGLLRSVPGVVVDRVNIAGNESGQQASYAGKGADSKDNTWSIDGVAITDLAATGASPTYFDQDAFAEVNVATGGENLTIMTGGVGLSFVTKRGTNSFRGTARGYFTNDDLQSDNLPPSVATHLLPSGQPDNRLLRTNPDGTTYYSDKANHIQQVSDYGFDFGGPILKNKLWFWGSIGKQDIRLVNFVGTADKTVLKDYNAKINWQATSNDMITGFWFLGAKEKIGRSPGTGLTEADGVLFDQAGSFPSGWHGLWKAEWNHVFSPSFFMNGKFAYYGTGFGFIPHGGMDSQFGLNYVSGNSYGSSYTYNSLRPQKTFALDGNYFTGHHELKFGFFYRKMSVQSSTAYSGGIKAVTQPTGGIAQVIRPGVYGQDGKNVAGYIGDTFTKDRLTLNLGVRYDHQYTNNAASSTPANPMFPELLPALSFDGGGTGIDWNTWSPRAGITYALDESRKTVLRASYARYAGQVPLAQPSVENPVAVSYLAYNWADANNDGFVQQSEVLLNEGVQYSSNVDPSNPAAVGSTVNKIDPNVKANIDNEFIVGIDRELAPNLAISLSYSYRKSSDLQYRPRISPISYAPNAPVTVVPAGVGGTYTGFTYSPNVDEVLASGSGRIWTNTPDYNRSFNGFEFTLNKRLSNKWMSRVGFAYNNWQEHYGHPVGNPTSTAYDANPDIFVQQDGGQYVYQTSGSGRSYIFGSSKWTLAANALYQLPWTLELSGALFGRQGFPLPVWINLPAGRDGTLRPLTVAAVDTTREQTLWNLDLRLAKNIIMGGTTLTLSAEGFNILNSDTELKHANQANAGSFMRVDEIINPRIFRFGARLSF